MTYLPRLESLPSMSSCSRQHILDITPGIRFLNNPTISAYPVDTCSIDVADGECREVTSFLRFVLRSVRVVLSTGFRGDETGQLDLCQLLAFPILGKPLIRVGLVGHHDGSTYICLRYPFAAYFRELAGRIPVVLDFLPASQIEGQSLLWGRRISLFIPAVGNCAPYRTSSCLGQFGTLS